MNERTIVTSRKINKKVIQGRYRFYSLIFIFIRILDKFFHSNFVGLTDYVLVSTKVQIEFNLVFVSLRAFL